MNLREKRLARELDQLRKEANETGIVVLEAENFDNWLLQISGAPETLYSGECFVLQVTFPVEYPIKAPEVIFLHKPPINEHIYSNGHICLSILYDHWSPTLTVSGIALSIISMLSSATKKQSPPDDAKYISLSPTSPKQTIWNFHGKISCILFTFHLRWNGLT
jgi:ubiquitin-conjugating enzyme E2 W